MKTKRYRSKIDAATAEHMYTQLAATYGNPMPTHPSGRPLDVLVETILSQHTSDKNSHRAFLSLRKAFPRWQELPDAPLTAIEASIRSGGLAKQKSKIIRQVLRIIREREGRVTLDKLKRMPDDEVYAYLTSLPGIGSKTACCVMLFALDRCVMPVDTHVHRISKRIGLIRANHTPEHARLAWEERLPRERLYHAHVLLIAHGRLTCKAVNPRCESCAIQLDCPIGRKHQRKKS